MYGFFNPFETDNAGGGGGGSSEKIRYSISKSIDLSTGKTAYRLTQKINDGSPIYVGDVIGFDGDNVIVEYDGELISLNEAISNLENYIYELPPATTTTLGGVKVGSGLTVEADGTLNAVAKIYYNTTEYWNQHGSEMTEVGAFYVYLDAKDWRGNKAPRLKVGNGILNISEMPFIDEYSSPTEPIYIDPQHEAIVDDGDQDIFPEEPGETFYFSPRVGTSADGDEEKLYLNY